MQTDAIRLICLLHCQLCSETVKQWCEDHPEFELVLAAQDGVYDVATLAAHMPDVVVLDLDLPGDALRVLPTFESNSLRYRSLSWALSGPTPSWSVP